MFKLFSAIKKDVKVLLRDKIGVTLMFLMPVLLVIIVTSIQNSTFQLINKSKLPLLVINHDSGGLGWQFIASIDKTGFFKTVLIKGDTSKAFINAGMQKYNSLFAIVIPENFSKKIKEKAKIASEKALQNFGIEEKTSEKKIIENKSIVLYFNPSIQEPIKYSAMGSLSGALQVVETRETLRSLYFSINEKEMPVNVENEILNNKSDIIAQAINYQEKKIIPNVSQHNVPAWTIFAMFFIVMSLGGSMVREKLSGSFIRMKTLPTSFLIGLASKQITYLMVTMIQAIIIFLIGLWIFPFLNLPKLNLPEDIFALIIVTLICGWCAVSYAACIGTFAQTQEQANGFGAVSIIILSIIGGLMIPSFAMQGFFKYANHFSPLHWCLEAYQGLFLRGASLKDVLPNILPLIIIALILQLITYFGLKRKNLI